MNHPAQQQQTKHEPDRLPVEALEQAWFEPVKNTAPSAREKTVEKLGEFLGDPLADHWLR